MNFDSLFQDYEGVFSLTKQRTKVLFIFSLTGVLTTVVLTVAFAFNVDHTKYLPGIIVLGSMFTLSAILLLQKNYTAALRIVYFLPLALYFFYINPYYAISGSSNAIPGLLSFIYFGFLYLIFFGDKPITVILYFFETLLTLLITLFSANRLPADSTQTTVGLFLPVHPLIEFTITSALSFLIFLFFNNLTTKISADKAKLEDLINESLKLTNIGVMVLSISRDEHDEKSGMKIIQTNACFEKNFRISKSEILQVDYSDIFPIIFRDSFNWQEVFFHSGKNCFNVYIKHLEKSFLIQSFSPKKDLIISTFTDTTDQWNETDRLKKRESRLTNLLGSLPDIFFIIEKDGTYIDYVTNNPELMKLSQKDIIGKTIFDMGFSNLMANQVYSSIQYVIENDNIETIEYGMELSNGKTLIFEMRLAKLNDNQIISIGRDITSIKEYQQQLIEAKKKTEEASRLKSSFLENISHEIRTPMNAILGFSNMAISDLYSESEKSRFLDIIIKNGEYLIDVITNIIDISEIESGTISFNPDPFLVNEMFMNIYQKFQSKIESINPNIKIKLSIGNDSSDIEIINDSYLIIKIINHLVENAIKFTKEGTVTFGYELENNRIKIFAQDTGIGIEEKDYENIFEFFRQVDNRVSRSYSGTGAGLKIVKGLTEIIGSNIEFNSAPKKGSVFYFYVPLQIN